MTARTATFYNRRYNAYVPAMGYACDVIHAAPHRVNFGAPAAADPDGILGGQTIAEAVTVTTFLLDEADAPFGRNVTVVANGIATSAVTVNGKDYLGQPMTESFTLNGTTPVVGVKAFYWIDSVVVGATADRTIDLGFGTKFGLPYRMQAAIIETVDGDDAAAGTFVSGVLTDPQTATTVDPRGTYVPTTTPNGTKILGAVFIPNSDVNAAGNGGLHGIAHYSA